MVTAHLFTSDLSRCSGAWPPSSAVTLSQALMCNHWADLLLRQLNYSHMLLGSTQNLEIELQVTYGIIYDYRNIMVPFCLCPCLPSNLHDWKPCAAHQEQRFPSGWRMAAALLCHIKPLFWDKLAMLSPWDAARVCPSCGMDWPSLMVCSTLKYQVDIILYAN